MDKNGKKKTVGLYKGIRTLSVVMLFMFVVSGIAGAGSASTNVTNDLCHVYSTLYTIVFILGIVLVILGAVMYAVGHILPATSRGSIQGYGTGMIMAGIIAVIIAIAAPYIMSAIGGSAFANAMKSCPGAV